MIYIIIPVHNRKHLTRECLISLRKQTYKNFKTIIIDDGSTDGTSEMIKNKFPEVIVLHGDGNLWWTGAMAQGMQYAYKHGAECFIWLNDDCIPEPDTLFKLTNFMQGHPNTIVGSSCYRKKSNSLVKINTAFKGRKVFAANPGEVIYVDGFSGYCVGIPTSVFRKIGPPDAKRFPQYAGDTAYTLRATRSGFKACVVGDIKVTLIGLVNKISDFRRYFQPSISPFKTFYALFQSKKSPYRLTSVFFYQTERYGWLLGTSFFLTKLCLWLTKWAVLQFIYSLRFNKLNNGKISKKDKLKK